MDPLPPPPNKEIFVPFLTPSLLPKIRKSDIFSGVFKKPNFAFLSHNESVNYWKAKEIFEKDAKMYQKGDKKDLQKDFLHCFEVLNTFSEDSPKKTFFDT